MLSSFVFVISNFEAKPSSHDNAELPPASISDNSSTPRRVKQQSNNQSGPDNVQLSTRPPNRAQSVFDFDQPCWLLDVQYLRCSWLRLNAVSWSLHQMWINGRPISLAMFKRKTTHDSWWDSIVEHAGIQKHPHGRDYPWKCSSVLCGRLWTILWLAKTFPRLTTAETL